jgi:uncharacterized protein YsxB (DUF464 family)
VRAVVLQRVPHGGERRRDQVQHVDAARHERHVVVLDERAEVRVVRGVVCAAVATVIVVIVAAVRCGSIGQE